MRTLDPLTSITSMTISSPSMIFSPGRLVMMSNGPLLGRWSEGEGTWCRDLCGDLGTGCFIDHLVAPPVGNEDRRAQVEDDAVALVVDADGGIDRVLG